MTDGHIGETNIVSSDGGLDIRAMRDISVEPTPELESQKKEKPVIPVEEPEKEEETVEIDDSLEADSQDEVVDNDTDSEDSQKTVDKVTFKDGDKDVAISKDAKVEIKINGKKETMTLSEALANASGNVHIARETSRLGRESKQLQEKSQAFEQTVAQVNENAAALLEITDPYELCEYICELKGGDPDELFETMVKNTVEVLQKYKGMTDRELELERENRKYRRDLKVRESKQKASQETQQKQEKRQSLETTLKNEGFAFSDFESTLDEMQEAIKNGEELGFGLDNIENPTENDIIDYMIAKNLDNRVMSELNKVSPKLGNDQVFVDRLKKTILKTESLYGKMSDAEVASFIRQALEVDNKALSENLSKKVKATNSKSVYSKEQEEDEGPATLDEFFERRRSTFR
jgi:hypothetical protein